MKNMSNDTKKFEPMFNVHQAAAFLNLKETTIYKWCYEKKIPAYKVGGSWRFSPTELEAWSKLSNQKTDKKRNG